MFDDTQVWHDYAEVTMGLVRAPEVMPTPQRARSLTSDPVFGDTPDEDGRATCHVNDGPVSLRGYDGVSGR